MPVSRMRMRPWLECMIDSNKFDGLHWVDKERTMFSIPWKHAARHGWEVGKDASLFKEWAIHTGKYVEGSTIDAKTWKANFRCAMNSLPDIEEVKDKSINKGHGAVRVFRMLPVTTKPRDRRPRAAKQRRHSKVKYEEDSSDSDYVPSPSQAHLPPLNESRLDSTMDSTVDSTVDSSVDSTVKREQTDATYMNHDEVHPWSSLGFDMPRRLQISPAHSPCPDDREIIEICAEWEKEVCWLSSQGNNGVLSNEVPCTSPGSMYSECSSADELEETKYINLCPSFPTTTDVMWSSFYPFSS